MFVFFSNPEYLFYHGPSLIMFWNCPLNGLEVLVVEVEDDKSLDEEYVFDLCRSSMTALGFD
jgi:hypothetical protein